VKADFFFMKVKAGNAATNKFVVAESYHLYPPCPTCSLGP